MTKRDELAEAFYSKNNWWWLDETYDGTLIGDSEAACIDGFKAGFDAAIEEVEKIALVNKRWFHSKALMGLFIDKIKALREGQ